MPKKTFSLPWLSSTSLQRTLPLLLIWIAIGTVLRFIQLTGKPPWTDEFATLVFSLGNSYKNVPLDQIISPATLLEPLKIVPNAGLNDVFTNLINEDNHPPIYFLLAHLWQKLLPQTGEYVSLWVARSLPAFLGVLSIPAIYFLSIISFRSRLVAHFAAAMMALSPYSIFLSQEARHYTLAILFVIASLTCLIAALQKLIRGQKLPWWLVIVWLIINSLGFTTHYFFSLTLCAQAISLLTLFWPKIKQITLPVSLWRLGIVVAGTIITSLTWVLVFIPQDYGNNMVAWIQNDGFSFLSLINPPFQLFATWLTMVYLLPVEASSLIVVIASGLIMLFLFLFALPLLIRGLKIKQKNPNAHIGKKILTSFIIAGIAIFLFISYFLGIDITRGARYSFVYFPAVIVLFAASLSQWWKAKELIPQPYGSFLLKKFGIKNLQTRGKNAIKIIFIASLLSAVTVIINLGYQKYYRPDLFVSLLKETSNLPVLIATTHASLVQTGEMMGIAWELQQEPFSQPVNFLLAHQEERESLLATKTLQQEMQKIPRPFDLWAVNFYAPKNIDNCVKDESKFPHIDGYGYEVYRCK